MSSNNGNAKNPLGLNKYLLPEDDLLTGLVPEAAADLSDLFDPPAVNMEEYDRLIDDVLGEQAIDLSAGYLPEDDTKQ